METANTLTVRLDDRRPATKALYNATVRRYRSVSLRFRVNDTVSPKATVRVRFRKVGSSAKKTVSLGLRTTGRNLSYSYRCTLAKGTWEWKVYATDLAGNPQGTMTSKKLYVR